MKWLWRLGWLGLVLFLGIGIYRAGYNELPSPPASQNVTFNSGNATGHRLKTKSWSAEYDRIVTNADQTVLDLQNVHNGVIYRKAKPYLRVRAKQLSVNTLTHDFSARGPLHIETVDSRPARSFDTTDATWTDSTQELAMPEQVVVHSGADKPLLVGSLSLNVRTGDLNLHHVTGSVRFK